MVGGCTSVTWDPSDKIGGREGHLTGVPETPRADHEPESPPAEGIALGDEGDGARPRVRIERGTGRFVREVTRAPTHAEPGDVTLNFDNTDIREVVKVILGDLLGVNYVLDPAVQGAVSLQTGRPLRRELLIPTLETLLRMSNAALVERGDGYEVVPIANAARGRVTPQLGESARALPAGYNLQVVPLRYIGAREMASILEPLAPEGSIVRVDALRNVLLIAATGREMSSLLDTIDVFDVDWMAGLSVGFFTLEYAKAGEVASQLQALLADEGGSNPLSGLFRFVPVENANALLVITPQARYLDKMRDWIARLDLAEASSGMTQRVYVYRVKHNDAENLADVLGQLFGSGGSNRQHSVGSVAPGLREASIGNNEHSSTTSGQGLSSGSSSRTSGSQAPRASSSQLELSSEVNVVADAANNSLLIRATPRDYKKILDALKQLDLVPLQVLVEATIVEIKLAGSLKYGVQWQFLPGKKDADDYRNLLTLSEKNDGSVKANFPGFNWSVILQPDTIRATLSALASDGLVNVLSSPSVMVRDNQEAKIRVGQEVPIVTNQQQGTTATDRILQQIQYRETGIILTVKPRVTPGGLVQLDIAQEVSSVESETGALNSPTFRTRKINSNVAVRSNQAVVLGGLIQDERADGKSGVPGLYRAPLIGPLFGQTNRRADRTELVVILTPRVIASATDIDTATADFRSKLKNLRTKF